MCIFTFVNFKLKKNNFLFRSTFHKYKIDLFIRKYGVLYILSMCYSYILYEKKIRFEIYFNRKTEFLFFFFLRSRQKFL